MQLEIRSFAHSQGLWVNGVLRVIGPFEKLVPMYTNLLTLQDQDPNGKIIFTGENSEGLLQVNKEQAQLDIIRHESLKLVAIIDDAIVEISKVSGGGEALARVANAYEKAIEISNYAAD